jgi:hypothetical protein
MIYGLGSTYVLGCWCYNIWPELIQGDTIIWSILSLSINVSIFYWKVCGAYFSIEYFVLEKKHRLKLSDPLLVLYYQLTGDSLLHFTCTKTVLQIGVRAVHTHVFAHKPIGKIDVISMCIYHHSSENNSGSDLDKHAQRSAYMSDMYCVLPAKMPTTIQIMVLPAHLTNSTQNSADTECKRHWSLCSPVLSSLFDDCLVVASCVTCFCFFYIPFYFCSYVQLCCFTCTV